MKPFVTSARRAALCLLAVVVLFEGVGAQDLPANVPDLLNQAFIQYKIRPREAEALCDRVTRVLQDVVPLSDLQLQQLLTAYELRGRARFLLKLETNAKEDFRAILMRSPAHEFGSLTNAQLDQAISSTISAFEAIRKETVGSVVFNITPADAEVRFRNAVLPIDRRTGGKQVLTPVGTHTLTVQRRMFEPVEIPVEVKPGLPVRVDLELKRVRAQIDFITSVPGVEVLVDGTSHGVTTDGPMPSRYVGQADVVVLGSTPGLRTVMDVLPGERQIQLKKACYTTDAFTMPIDVPSERYIARTMTKASAPLDIKGAVGTVWIDGEQQKGQVPFVGDLCPKTDQRERLIEVRSARGRQVLRVEPLPGRKIEIVADPRPAIAILAANGLPAGFTEDLRQTLEKALLQAGVREVMFFSERAEAAREAMKAAGVDAGWLAIDVDGRLLLNSAVLTTASTRQTASLSLSARLDVQGVAEITVPAFSRAQKALVLTYLAAGSSVPEAIPINLDEPRSVQAAATYFNDRFRLIRVGSGLSVADVPGVPGAVVLHQSWKTTGEDRLFQGDVITSANGTKVADASAFEALVAGGKAGQAITLQVQRGKGNTGPSTVQLTPIERKQVVAFDDQTLSVNKRLLEFRVAVEDAPPQQKDIARLNLAIVLMRMGSWSEAKTELDKIALVDLKEGDDISRGTVQYYLGVCLDGLGRTDEADRAYQAARDSPGAWLTADGLLVKPFAEQKLADVDKTRRIR